MVFFVSTYALSLLTDYSPDARPPRNVLQRFGRYGYGFIRWWATPDVIFALKYAAATLVIWLPQVFKSTAWLAYTEKVRCRMVKLFRESSDSFSGRAACLGANHGPDFHGTVCRGPDSGHDRACDRYRSESHSLQSVE